MTGRSESPSFIAYFTNTPVNDWTLRILAARANGFDELSRLAQLYKRHFGELPSETLAKHSDHSSRSAGS